jgi:hypothetical protein
MMNSFLLLQEQEQQFLALLHKEWKVSFTIQNNILPDNATVMINNFKFDASAKI